MGEELDNEGTFWFAVSTVFGHFSAKRQATADPAGCFTIRRGKFRAKSFNDAWFYKTAFKK